jgi:K+-transporting ATPase A subunit
VKNGSEAFFQVAVALVPAFLFGRAIRKPEQGWPSDWWARVLVVAVLAVTVVAEVFAIRGVIDPGVTALSSSGWCPRLSGGPS